MCMEAKDCKLREKVDALDNRVTQLEKNMNTGFTSVTNAVTATNAAVAQLATDFGQRMNTLDLRIVEEKAKWGETLRRIVLWSAGTLLAGAAVAMGVTIIKNILAL